MITRQPVKGDTVEYVDAVGGSKQNIRVDHCNDKVCLSQVDEISDSRCFIWKFSNGEMNKLHTIVEGG